MKKACLIFILLFSCINANANDTPFPDPYPEIYEQIQVLPPNIHGWVIHEGVFDPLLAEKKFSTVIEVGVWLGKMTTYMAPKLPQGSRYYAVDHWKGSEEHRVPGSVENECLKNLYQQFLSNIIHAGLQDIVIPVRMRSLDAAKKFEELNIKADLIYIDAAHDYINVLQDLYAWYPLLTPEGMFCGDDWQYGGVRTAVKQFAAKKGLKILLTGNFWQLVPEEF